MSLGYGFSQEKAFLVALDVFFFCLFPAEKHDLDIFSKLHRFPMKKKYQCHSTLVIYQLLKAVNNQFKR